MKRRYAVFAVIFAVSVLIGIQAVEVVKANPMTFPTSTSPPDSVTLTITVDSPKQNTSYSNGTINVCFNKTINSPNGISTSTNIISTYQGDWMKDSRWCPFPADVDRFATYHFLQYNFNITDIPVGEHTLNITAQGQGGFNKNNTEYSFTFQKTVSIKFSIISSNQPSGTSPPTTTILSSTTTTPELPSPTPNQKIGSDYWINPTALATTVIVIVIVAVASISLVYFKKHGGRNK